VGQRDGSSRGDLRRRARELEKERDELLERLVATNAELKLHAAWCQLDRPSWLRRHFNTFWVWLTEKTAKEV
jgi:hypothetical protein